MPHMNIYVPEKIEKRVRREAKLKGKSVSAYIGDLLKGQVDRKGWHKDFFTKVVGGWKGNFPAIKRGQPEEREAL
jgi:hypothetical protein